MIDPLGWDDSYEIARALIDRYPDVDLDKVSLEMIYRWTIALPGFEDESELVNDEILAAIFQEWFEEVNPV
jgi:FeS assembly protein IscX